MPLFYSPRIRRTQGSLGIGTKPGDLISFWGATPVAQPVATGSTRSALEALGLVAPAGSAGISTGVTATTDGLTTGIIPAGAEFVTVTSSASTKVVTLPAPVPGKVVRIYVGANGYKLQTTAPASIAINGGTGASAVSAVGANVELTLKCVTPTLWLSTSVSSVGATTAGAVAA